MQHSPPPDEDLDEKSKEWVKTQKELEEELETIQKFANEPKIKGDFVDSADGVV